MDLRRQWLFTALAYLVAEMDDDALPASLTLITTDGAEMMSYSIGPDSGNVEKVIITHPSALIAAAQMTTVNATVEEVPDENG
jgi:hypothetical protein